LSKLLNLLERIVTSAAGRVVATFLSPLLVAIWGTLQKLDPFVTATLALSVLCLILAGIVLWPTLLRWKTRELRRAVGEFAAKFCHPASGYLRQAFDRAQESVSPFEGKLFVEAVINALNESARQLARVLQKSADEREIAAAFDGLVERYVSGVVWYHEVAAEKGYLPSENEYVRWQRAHRDLTRALRDFVNTSRYRCLNYTNGRLEIMDRW
jgi:hypothetical protein